MKNLVKNNKDTNLVDGIVYVRDNVAYSGACLVEMAFKYNLINPKKLNEFGMNLLRCEDTEDVSEIIESFKIKEEIEMKKETNNTTTKLYSLVENGNVIKESNSYTELFRLSEENQKVIYNCWC